MSNVLFLSRHRFLIIGGTSKAGTTSVFNYLQGHPQVRAAFSKETRFYLEKDYPLPSQRRCQKDGSEAYQGNFAPRGKENVRA
jgi:hypothetical protein